MGYDVRVLHVPATPFLAVRRRAARSEFSRVVPEGCGTVWDFIQAAGLVSGGRNLAVYLDGEIDLEIGVEIDAAEAAAALRDGSEVRLSRSPAGRVATTTHEGPYRGLGDAHEAVQRWCEANGHALAGPCWEIYGHIRDEKAEPTTDVLYLISDPNA